MNIVLIGYRGSGKTVVGRCLAERLNMGFVDTDFLVQERTGCSVSQMIERDGWQFFRDIEREVVRNLSRDDGLVIATGGGVVLDPNNVLALKERGFLVWLKAGKDVLRRRIENDPKTLSLRPPLRGISLPEELETMLGQREPYYRSAADMWVDTSFMAVNDVVELIVTRLRQRGL